MRAPQGSWEMRNRLEQPNRKSSRPKRRGIVLVLTAVALVAVLGMIGLAVDLGVAYFLKARLSQAVDAAALAGARSLSRGDASQTQADNATAVATSFFNANFPNGFWGSTTSIQTLTVLPYNPSDPTKDETKKIRYVTISATATIPLYFMRALGKTTTVIGTSAQAARRDANIMIILDRSGSMTDAIAQLVQSADWFASQFSPGRDKVGLVTFGGTYNLIKPTLTSIPDVRTSINKLSSSNVNGTTNHAQPLWVAYQALAEANEPAALNAIVFFTDGQPNTIMADWSTTDGTTTNLNTPGTCSNGMTGAVYNPVIGYALVDTGNGIQGLFATTLAPPYQPNSTSLGTVPTAYVSTPSDKYGIGSQVGDSSAQHCPNCEVLSVTYSSGCGFSTNITKGFKQIPTQDYYGNKTAAATKYKSVTLSSFTYQNLIAAAFNAGDYAAQRMRAGALGAPTGIVPLIDTIALNTGQTPDSVYMKRLANSSDSANSIYDSSKPTGIYVYASTTGDLQSAFVQIASQILHLSL